MAITSDHDMTLDVLKLPETIQKTLNLIWYMPRTNKPKTQLLENGCINWLLGKDKNGYPKITKTDANGHKHDFRVHRLIAMVFLDDYNEAMLVCHSCDNPSCINPEHLFMDTTVGNIRDASDKKHLHGQDYTHCLRDHEYTPENTYIKQNGTRSCRHCMREYYWRKNGTN